MHTKVEYQYDWVKGELSDPKFSSKTVKAKPDYKREQKSMAKLRYETSTEFDEQPLED